MRSLTASEMLEVWGTAAALSPTRRALAVLLAATPEAGPDELAALSIGARDARLLSLREWFFGPRVVGQATCPVCDERLECAFDIDDVRIGPPESDDDPVTYRLPDSTDLEAIASAPDEATAVRRLLQRCVSDQTATLSATQRVALVDEMARRDPQACIELSVTCHACQHPWSVVFDIASFFWTEVHAWAQRTLRDVHTLASAYGWSEQEILGLSNPRRQAYLELVAG
jgi:hypothetical protein